MVDFKKIEECSSGLHKDAFVNGKAALTFDDVWMVPQFSDIKSRDEVDLRWEIFDDYKCLPFNATCMDTVCGHEMLAEMVSVGCTGMLHRGCAPDAQGDMMYQALKTLCENGLSMKPECHDVNGLDWILGYAVSCGSWQDRLKEFNFAIKRINDTYDSDGVKYYICLDVAHAHTSMYKETLKALHDYCCTYNIPVKILAGTIATPQAAEYLYEYCDGIRVGVGSGSACTTRINTGHGVPLFQSLIETAEVCHDLGIKCFADGGLRTSGDMVKALSVGADCLNLGGVLASTSKSPAEKIYGKSERDLMYDMMLERNPNYQIANIGENLFNDERPIVAVRYRGMASKDAQKDYSEKSRKSGYYVEGESFEMPYTGETSDVINDFIRGIRSGLSYSGSRNIQELRDKARFRTATVAGLAEAKPHGKK